MQINGKPRLEEVLADLMDDPKQVSVWLQDPNPAFDGSKSSSAAKRTACGG